MAAAAGVPAPGVVQPTAYGVSEESLLAAAELLSSVTDNELASVVDMLNVNIQRSVQQAQAAEQARGAAEQASGDAARELERVQTLLKQAQAQRDAMLRQATDLQEKVSTLEATRNNLRDRIAATREQLNSTNARLHKQLSRLWDISERVVTGAQRKDLRDTANGNLLKLRTDLDAVSRETNAGGLCTTTRRILVRIAEIRAAVQTTLVETLGQNVADAAFITGVFTSLRELVQDTRSFDMVYRGIWSAAGLTDAEKQTAANCIITATAQLISLMQQCYLMLTNAGVAVDGGYPQDAVNTLSKLLGIDNLEATEDSRYVRAERWDAPGARETLGAPPNPLPQPQGNSNGGGGGRGGGSAGGQGGAAAGGAPPGPAAPPSGNSNGGGRASAMDIAAARAQRRKASESRAATGTSTAAAAGISTDDDERMRQRRRLEETGGGSQIVPLTAAAATSSGATTATLPVIPFAASGPRAASPVFERAAAPPAVGGQPRPAAPPPAVGGAPNALPGPRRDTRSVQAQRNRLLADAKIAAFYGGHNDVSDEDKNYGLDRLVLRCDAGVPQCDPRDVSVEQAAEWNPTQIGRCVNNLGECRGPSLQRRSNA